MPAMDLSGGRRLFRAVEDDAKPAQISQASLNPDGGSFEFVIVFLKTRPPNGV
jgi:hypothetical protein